MFACSSCGRKYAKWVGKCLECDSWEIISLSVENKIVTPVKTIDIKNSNIRHLSGVKEFDNALGGGLVAGSVVLLAGSPGIGKSTLLLQVVACYNNALYVSGEESEHQIKGRASRLNINLEILSSSSIDSVLKIAEKYKIIVIDSIQTMNSESFLPGSIAQVREVISKIIEIAKSKNIAFIVVGHINKEGQIAGPKILEHMVDVVLEFEGDKDLHYRILRAVKNRFGSINEIGVFQMEDTGIVEVANPSEFFIDSNSQEGSVIVPVIEGNRVFLIEIQALTTNAMFTSPRRISKGIDSSLTQIISAVVERYLKINLYSQDIFFNIPGSFTTKDPAIGLGIALAIYSSFRKKNIESAALGEVGLTGEIRKVTFISKRIKELEKLGFKRIYIPYSNLKELPKTKIEVVPLKNLKDLLDIEIL